MTQGACRQAIPRSGRIRCFAAWAVLRQLGRNGIRDMIRGHCRLAEMLAERLRQLPGVTVLNEVRLNQVAISLSDVPPEARATAIERLSSVLNEDFGQFERPTVWKGQPVLRVYAWRTRLSVRCLRLGRGPAIQGPGSNSTLAHAWEVFSTNSAASRRQAM
jgi:hypothetical protein